MERDGARYYGPFTSAYAVRQTLDVLRRVFPYLDCNREITGQDPKPCLYYHIKRCAGPCIGAVDKDGYRQIIAGLAEFPGRQQRGSAGADERAGCRRRRNGCNSSARRMLRDQIRAAGQLVERQKVVSGKQEDEDVIAFAQDAAHRRGVRAGLLHPPRQADRPGELRAGRGQPPSRTARWWRPSSSSSTTRRPSCRPASCCQKDLDERDIIEQWLRGRRGGEKVLLQRADRRAQARAAADGDRKRRGDADRRCRRSGRPTPIARPRR